MTSTLEMVLHCVSMGLVEIIRVYMMWGVLYYQSWVCLVK